MKEIHLTQGKIALVDDEDFEWLQGFSWCAHRIENKTREIWYAATNLRGIDGRTFTAHMHCMILIVEKGFEVDHIDSDGLHNFKSNLRQASKSQQRHNQIKRRGRNGKLCSSRFKGVGRSGQRWVTHITVDYKPRVVGHFDSEIEAAKAYDLEAIKEFGEFAKLNFSIQPATIK